MRSFQKQIQQSELETRGAASKAGKKSRDDFANEDSWAVKLLLALLGTIVGLLVIELSFRIVVPGAEAKSHMRADRPQNYYLPSQTKDNRDFDYPFAKQPGDLRLVVVGDSFTYAAELQFDDNFAKRLERMLNLNGEHRAEVFNWGVPGYSTAQELRLVQRALSSYSPDGIVLQVTLNDPEMQPYRVANPHQNSNGEIILDHPLFSYWKSLGFVVSRIYGSISQRQFKEYYFGLFENNITWERFRVSILEVSKICKERGVPLDVVVFPLFSHRLDAQYPFLPLHRKIDSLLQEAEIPYLDLLDEYQGIPPERLQVRPGQDSHPNEIAHRIAADAIYRDLLRHHIVPADFQIKTVQKRPLLRVVPPPAPGVGVQQAVENPQ